MEHRPDFRSRPTVAPAVVLVVLLVLSWTVACSRPQSGDEVDEVMDGSQVHKLLDSRSPEDRLEPVPIYHERLDLDLSREADRNQVRFIAMQTRPVAEGLRLEPDTDDPILYLGNRNMPFNRVTLVMQSPVSTFLEVFWSTGGMRFDAEHKVRVPVSFSSGAKEYVVDLPFTPDPAEEYEIRIDPVDGRIPVTMSRIEFSRVAFRPPGSDPTPGAGPRTGKVALGDVLRTVVALGPEGAESWSVPMQLRQVGYLSFGLGAPQEQATPAVFQLLFLPDGGDGDEEVLFETRVDGASRTGWVDHRVRLAGLEGRRGQLRARVRADAADVADGPPVVYWAEPRFVPVEVRANRPNLVLISLDTLAAGHLALFHPEGEGERLASLESLAARGTVFENLTSSSSLTHVSHATMLSGYLPLSIDPFWLTNERQGQATLAALLRKEGYVTGAFTGGVMLTERLGFDRGFETFYQADTLFRPFLERSDAVDVTRRALGWLDTAAPGPFFLFLHTYEVHGPHYFSDDSWRRRDLAGQPFPYNYVRLQHMRGLDGVSLEKAGDFVNLLATPETERRLEGIALSEEDRLELMEAYHQEIGVLDQVLQHFLAELDARGHLDNTVVVVTSDHGEAFLEHGLFEHGLLYEENLRVPLIVVSPGRIPAGHRVATPVHQVDLAPTMLELVGVEAEGELDGRSILPLLENQEPLAGWNELYSFVPASGFAWKTAEGRKLILRMALLQESFGRHEMFDLATDPGETTNLLAAGEEPSEELRRAVRRTLREVPAVFVGLEALAGGDYDVTFSGPGLNKESLYGIEVEADDFREEGPLVWRGRLRPRDGGMLFLLAAPSHGAVEMELAERGGEGEPLRYRVPLEQLTDRHLSVAPDGRSAGPRLSVWRVGKAFGSGSGEPSEEVEEKLRSLGYIQ